MRSAYCSGAPGTLVSAAVWLTAGLVAAISNPIERAVWVLLVGGATIHPLSVLLCKLVGAAGQHRRGNPLAGLAAASTVWMLLMLPLAYALSQWRIEWFFPAMLLVIGGRYLTFGTLFGIGVYWLLGFALAGTAFALVALKASVPTSAIAGAAVECVFGAILFVRHRQLGREQVA